VPVIWATLSSYSSIGIETVPADVVVGGPRACLVEFGTFRCRRSIMQGTTSAGEHPAAQALNASTLVQGGSAPERLIPEWCASSISVAPDRLEGMWANLSSYWLVGVDAVPVEVQVDTNRVRVVVTEMGGILHSVKLRTTSQEDSTPEQVVNALTLAPGRSAPADLKKKGVLGL